MSSMGVSSRRERDRLALREKILDAARELFAAEGYEAVTLRKIAERIEYSTTAIYVHFRDKRALIQELISEDFGAHAEHFKEALEISDPFDRLARVGELYVDFARRYPNHYRFMFMTQRPLVDEGDEEPDDPEPDLSLSSYAILVDTVEACIATGRLAEEYSDPQLVAHAMWAVVHGVVSLELVVGCRIELPPMVEAAKRLTTAAVRGMLAADS